MITTYSKFSYFFVFKAYEEHSYPFLSRVRKSDAPDYYDIIKNPIDLSVMTKKIKRHEYNSKMEFQEDLDLMFSNCRKYNTDPGSIYVTHANMLDQYAKKLLKKVRNIDCKDRRTFHTNHLTSKDSLSSSPSSSSSKTSKKSKKSSSSPSSRKSSSVVTSSLSQDGIEFISSHSSSEIEEKATSSSKKSSTDPAVSSSPSVVPASSPSTSRRRNSRARGRGRPKKGKKEKTIHSSSSSIQNEVIDLQSPSTSPNDSMLIDLDHQDECLSGKETDPSDSSDHGPSALAETIHEFLAEDPQVRSWRLWSLESRIHRVVRFSFL